MADNLTLNQMSGGGIVATDDVGGVHVQRVKPVYGADGSATDVSASNPLPVRERHSGPWQTAEGALTAGTSPVTIDCNTALGRNANLLIVRNDGTGDFTVAMNIDGATWGDEATLKQGESLQITGLDLDSVRLTRVAADSNYRVLYL